MARYYFLDATGQKQGPYDEQQLQTLVSQGVITLNTPLETDGGHQGVAGQIPWLEFNAVVPPFLGERAQVISEQIKKWGTIAGIAVVAIVVGWVVLQLVFRSSPDTIKPLPPKSGDWIKYDVTLFSKGDSEKATYFIEVLTNDGRKVKLRTITTRPKNLGRKNEKTHEIDLPASEEDLIKLMLMQELPGAGDVKIEKDKKTKKTKATLSVADQKYNCTVTPYTLIITSGGLSLKTPIKEWKHKAIPITGSVKTEMRLTLPEPGMTEVRPVSVTMMLDAFEKM